LDIYDYTCVRLNVYGGVVSLS